MKCLLVEFHLSISSNNKHSLQITVIICESFVNLSPFFFMKLKDEHERWVLSYSHYWQRMKTNLSLCKSIHQSLSIYHPQEQSFSEKFWWKHLFFFLFWISCPKQSIYQHHQSTWSDLPRCATHKQKQHCSHEHFLTLPSFSIITTQARGAEIALLSAGISGDCTATQFKPNTPQHTTAQGKENLPVPSVSPRATTWRSCQSGCASKQSSRSGRATALERKPPCRLRVSTNCVAASHGSIRCTLCSNTARRYVAWSVSTRSSGRRATFGTQSAVRCVAFGSGRWLCGATSPHNVQRSVWHRVRASIKGSWAEPFRGF